MNFAHLKMLYLIWTLPVLLLVFIYGARKRRKILSAYADARALGRILPAGLPGRRRLRAGLVLCAMLLLAVALSGPQYGFHWQQIERRGIDIMIALDCSRSMLATDIQPTRLDRAKREIHDLLGMLQGDRVGLAAFGGTAFLQCPLTID
jgi:Ca-activated chloride channel homolog